MIPTAYLAFLFLSPSLVWQQHVEGLISDSLYTICNIISPMDMYVVKLVYHWGLQFYCNLTCSKIALENWRFPIVGSKGARFTCILFLHQNGGYFLQIPWKGCIIHNILGML